MDWFSWPSFLGRDESRADSVVKAIGREVAAIHGEDFSEILSLRNTQKGSVSKVHFAIGVFAHKFPDPWDVVRVERKQENRASFQHFAESFLRQGKV